MNIRSLFFTGLCFLISFSTKAQDHSDCKYGEITAATFNLKTEKFDSGANAIILADIEKVSFEENETRDFDVICKRYLRIKIINKNGFKSGEFILHMNMMAEKSFFAALPKPGLLDLKGVTYNLENGEIHRDYLNLANVFSMEEGKYLMTKKFAMPALKEGSVFDVEYTIRSMSIATKIDWNFQAAYPCHWSEYDLTLANPVRYTIKYQGDTSFFIHTTELVDHVSQEPSYHEKLAMAHYRWVKINEPAIVSEPYVGSLNNYADRVSLHGEWYLIDPRAGIDYSSSTWEGFSKLYFYYNGMEGFGNENYHWMKKDLEDLTAGLKTKNDMAKAIYRWVRDHFTCINYQYYFPSQDLKETYVKKSGDVADINFLLTAMLHQVHIDADPAVLSTVSNGYGNLTYPLVTDYNYMICVAQIDGKDVLLDASQPLNPYGMLRPDCYNGGAVTLNDHQCRLIRLLPDSLCETNRTDAIVTADEKGMLTGSLTIHCGTEKSHSIRDEIKKTSAKEYFTSFSSNRQVVRFSNGELEELGNPDFPITVHCDMDFRDSVNTDIIYLNPVILPQFEKNPFSSEKRKYIVEIPFRMDNIYLLTLDIPNGYRAEEIPSSSLIRLNGNEGSFEYIIEKNVNTIQLQIRMKLNKTFFTTEEYTGLREFFIDIIKKENEHIVLRKINPSGKG